MKLFGRPAAPPPATEDPFDAIQRRVQEQLREARAEATATGPPAWGDDCEVRQRSVAPLLAIVAWVLGQMAERSPRDAYETLVRSYHTLSGRDSVESWVALIQAAFDDLNQDPSEQ